MRGSGRREAGADAGAASLPGTFPRAARAHARVVLDLARLLQPLPGGARDALSHAVVRLWRCARAWLACADAFPLYLRRLPGHRGAVPCAAAQGPRAVQRAALAARVRRHSRHHAPHVRKRRHAQRPGRHAGRIADRRRDRRAAAPVVPLRRRRHHRAAHGTGVLGARPRCGGEQLRPARATRHGLLRGDRRHRLAGGARRLERAARFRARPRARHADAGERARAARHARRRAGARP